MDYIIKTYRKNEKTYSWMIVNGEVVYIRFEKDPMVEGFYSVTNPVTSYNFWVFRGVSKTNEAEMRIRYYRDLIDTEWCLHVNEVNRRGKKEMKSFVMNLIKAIVFTDVETIAVVHRQDITYIRNKLDHMEGINLTFMHLIRVAEDFMRAKIDFTIIEDMVSEYIDNEF